MAVYVLIQYLGGEGRITISSRPAWVRLMSENRKKEGKIRCKLSYYNELQYLTPIS